MYYRQVASDLKSSAYTTVFNNRIKGPDVSFWQKRKKNNILYGPMYTPQRFIHGGKNLYTVHMYYYIVRILMGCGSVEICAWSRAGGLHSSRFPAYEWNKIYIMSSIQVRKTDSSTSGASLISYLFDSLVHRTDRNYYCYYHNGR